MKKYKNKVICILFSVSLLFNGCSNNFLDLSDTSTLSPAYFPANIADMESLITSCYAGVIDFDLYGKRVMAKGTSVLDHTVDMAWKSDKDWNEMATNGCTVANAYVTTWWQGYYHLIGFANTALIEAEKINTASFSQADLNRLEQIKGEAYFWRGWAHQQLVQFWGEGYPCNGDGDKQGVVIHTDVPSTISQMNKPRSTVNEVYEQVLKDYDEAEKRLPDSWSNTADKSRPTKYSVESFRGQVYLFQGKYNEAKTELKTVIDNSGKSLLPFDEYSKMFNENQTKFNNESIQELSFKDHSATGWGNWGGGEGSMYAMVASLTFINQDGKLDNAGWGNIFFHDANIERFGSDPRLHITALEPGTPVIMNGFKTVVAKYQDTPDDYKAWSMGKYNPLTYSTYEVQVSVGIDMYLMRLADVYLMYAEACQASGDEANAKEYANKVRRRAYNLPINTPSNVDITSTGTQLRDDIREERFRELCGEGVQHWIDVCRWKTLDQEISRWYKKTLSGPPAYANKSLYLPIPKSEMLNNTAIKQSAGYENQ